LGNCESQMKKIKISELKIGQKFTRPLLLDQENIFLREYTPLTEADLVRLKKFGFKEVLTLGDVIDHGTSQTSPTTLTTTENTTDSLELENVNLNETFSDATESIRRAYEETIRKLPGFKSDYRNFFSVIQTFCRKIHEKKQVDFLPIRDVAEGMVSNIKEIPNISLLLLQNEIEGYHLYNHILYATYYSLILGNALEFNRPKLIDLACGSLLADIGMAKIPSEISEKKTPLGEDEVKLIKQHPVLGYHILTTVLKVKKSLTAIAMQHHENFDGSGYPQKIKGADIDELARVYTIADYYAALIMDRPWRKAILPYEALKGMLSVNTNKFDLRFVKLFITKLSIYPVGSSVELSDGRQALVVSANEKTPLRPCVLLTKDKAGNPLRPSTFIDLSKEKDMVITKAVSGNIS
jgi:HD-GYP domain-containing protein (c-di-GMP phosphodiesterase class II)